MQVLWPWWSVFRDICAHDRQWGQLQGHRGQPKPAGLQPTLLGLRMHEQGPDYATWRPVLAEMLQIPLHELPVPPMDDGLLPTSKVG